MSNLQRMTAGKLRPPGWRDRPPTTARGHPGVGVHGRARARPSGHARIAHPPRPPGRWRAPRRRRRARRTGVAPRHRSGAGGGRHGRRPGAHRGRLLGLRRPDRRAHGPPVGRGRPLLSRRGRGRVRDQRRAAHDPRGRRAARLTAVPPARTPAAARWPAGCASRRRGASAPHATRPDKMFHVGGWLVERALGRRGRWRSRSTRRSPRGWRARGGRATCWGSRPPRRSAWPRVVQRCAHGAFFRYPNVRLNQINWNAEVFAHAATMTGDTALLRRDYYLHMRRFVAGVHRPWLADHARARATAARPTSGPGYRFNYLTTRPPGDAFNLDSAEYANITVHFLLCYARARAAGHAGAAARRPRGAEGLGRARAARLLDPRRLSQLGLGPGSQALADRQDLRLRPAGAAGHRDVADDSTRAPSSAPGRSTSSTVAWRSTSAGPTRTAAGRSRPPAERRPTPTSAAATRARSSSARAWRPTPRAPSTSASASAPARAAAGLRLRPRHRAPGGLDAGLLDGRARRQPAAPSPTAASSSPASTTPTGGRSRPSAAGPRRLRRGRARRREPHAARLADEPAAAEPGRSAARLTRAPRGTGPARPPAARVRRAVQPARRPRGGSGRRVRVVRRTASAPIRRDHVEREVGGRARRRSTCSSPRGARPGSRPCCTTAPALP